MPVIGVDCHKTVHAAVAIDAQGQDLGQWRGPNTVAGWQDLVAWATEHGADPVWGIEGSGQYGRGLAQVVVQTGHAVHEVNPRLTAAMRRSSRARGKSDRLDARAIARVVQQDPSLPVVRAEDATAVLAVQVSARDGLVGEITALRNRLAQHLVQLAPVHDLPWPPLTKRTAVATLVDLRVPDADALMQAHASQVRLLVARILLAMDQVAALTAEITRLSAGWTAPLLAIVGVGPLTAGMVAAHLGGKTFATDAQLAMYAGVAPLDASSGHQTRHRLNRTGNRHLNAILHRIALTQSRTSPQATAYLAKKQAEGKTRTEAFRCLKRFLARAVLTAWNHCPVPSLKEIEAALT